MTQQRIIHGDSRKVLRKLEANSIDACVTDPPYELAFMGKSWDSSGISFDPKFWRKVYRVMKPGGHLLAFGGTRTWHRIAVAIEDAGFEFRDTIIWLYGSGFPKSLDVSKAIDKTDASKERLAKARRFQKWLTPILSPQEINNATSTNMGHHLTTHPTQPSIPTERIWKHLRPLISGIPKWVELLVRERTVESQNMKKRRVTGQRVGSTMPGFAVLGSGKPTSWNETIPYTSEAALWNGWGTGLKPAWEPVMLFRKPLEGTVATNVLKYGTGGLNIDATRIQGGLRPWREPIAETGRRNRQTLQTKSASTAPDTSKGRWPANVILDEEVGVMLDEQSGQTNDGVAGRRSAGVGIFGIGAHDAWGGYEGGGGASRFFYCAKASRLERELGLLEVPPLRREDVTGRKPDSSGQNHARSGKRMVGDIRNTHTTVKPLQLIQYLVRLVTPLDGTVLDPFLGSGTTAVACKIEGFNAIGIEQDERYVLIARHALRVPKLRRLQRLAVAHREERLEHDRGLRQGSLFGDEDE